MNRKWVGEICEDLTLVMMDLAEGVCVALRCVLCCVVDDLNREDLFVEKSTNRNQVFLSPFLCLLLFSPWCLYIFIL